MLGGQKKRNPDTAGDTKTDGPEQPPSIPRELPPLRTFVVRQPDLNNGGQLERTVEAHGLGVDENRMMSFVVFLYPVANDRTQVAQATKLILNADAWDEVEEINPLFPTQEKH